MIEMNVGGFVTIPIDTSRVSSTAKARLERRFQRFGYEAMLIGDDIPVIGIEYEEPAQDETGERYRNNRDNERSRAPETPLHRPQAPP